MVRSPRRRSIWPASGSSKPPTWTRRARARHAAADPPLGRRPPPRARHDVSADVGAVFRREYGRCVATLVRFLGDIDAAEEAVQEAFTEAAARWPSDGLPPN